MLAILVGCLCWPALDKPAISARPVEAIKVEKRDDYLDSIMQELDRRRAVGAWPVKWEKPK